MLCLDTDLGVLGSDGAGGLFARKAYVGNGATGQSIVNGLDTDFVWIKNEDAASPHTLYDAVRGIGNRLQANTFNTEGSFTGVSAFNVDGFSLGGFADTNNTGNQYVSFAWKEAANYFDVVTYTGTSSTLTVSHNLGSIPKLILVKSRTATQNWGVYHASLGNTKSLRLNTSDAETSGSGMWASTSPTTTTFTVASGDSGNLSGEQQVAYLFSDVAGLSSFGSYTGTGTTTQQNIDIGFAPTIVWIKNTAGGDWLLLQSSGKAWHINGANAAFNSSTSRTTTSATGFSIGTGGTTTNGDYNNSGDTYVYAAWKGV